MRNIKITWLSTPKHPNIHPHTHPHTHTHRAQMERPHKTFIVSLFFVFFNIFIFFVSSISLSMHYNPIFVCACPWFNGIIYRIKAIPPQAPLNANKIHEKYIDNLNMPSNKYILELDGFACVVRGAWCVFVWVWKRHIITNDTVHNSFVSTVFPPNQGANGKNETE